MKTPTSQSHFSVKILRIALLALMVACMAAPVLRLAAQQAAPASTSHEAAKSEEEQQNDRFLFEGPLVKASAKVLHLSVETTADIYLFINFAIIALAIVVPLARFMPKVVRKRSQTLSHGIDEARKATTDAHARLSAVESRLAGLDAEIAAIQAQVEQESVQDEVRIKAAIEEERARIVASAEQEIAQAAAHAQRGLRNFAADLAIEQAAKQMVLTPETDKALIAEFTAGLSKGGQN